jgi:GNAT superfamily N-acetyltransferase
MTTTLRPDGPEEALPGGGRSRRYAVCVNGRPVGGVRLGARPGPVAPVGSIGDLRIDAEGRRRGRGTVAVLAGEEVLRSWGCSRVEAAVPDGPGERAALGLAAALGYRVTSRKMAKRLPEVPPELPPGRTARPLGGDEFPAWRAESTAGYEASLRAAGYAAADARARAEEDTARLVPDRHDSPDHVLRRLLAGDRVVGTLWVTLDRAADPDGRRMAWVSEVEVADGERGRGHGRALMLLAERECLAAGVRDLGLNVFADNAPANALYRSLGYRTFRTSLLKYL